jgi:hypothetical protein
MKQNSDYTNILTFYGNVKVAVCKCMTVRPCYLCEGYVLSTVFSMNNSLGFSIYHIPPPIIREVLKLNMRMISNK